MDEALNLQTRRMVYQAFTEGNLQGILKPLASMSVGGSWAIMRRFHGLRRGRDEKPLKDTSAY